MPFTHLHWLQKTNKELNEVYLTLYLRKFAISLINIFIPIYLYTIGYSLNNILIFIAIWFLFQAIASYVASRINYKIGTKHTIMISVPILILFFWLLYEVPKWNMPLAIYFVAPLIAFSNGLYWVSTNGIFARNSHKKSPGKEVSYLMISSRLGSVLAPLIGGFILTELTFNYLFLIVGILLSLSLVPLFLSKDYSCRKKDNWFKILKENKKYFFAYFFQGILSNTTLFVIPFLILFLLKTYISIGLISSVLLVGSFIVILIVGKLTDSFEGKRIIRLGGLILSAILLILLYANNPIILYFASFIVGIGIVMIYLPIFAISSLISKKYNETEFMMLREMGLCAGRVFFVLLLLIFSDIIKIQVGLLIASLASLYFVLFR